MIELDLLQGSKEWLDARRVNFPASEAPMMMGDSKHISRTKLLDSKKGWTTEVDDHMQKLFDAGHLAEAMARPLAAKLIDSELYPVVGLLEDTKFMASFDGLTMMEDIAFEHKIYNKILAENVLNSTIGPDYYWQLEQQLMVSGAEKVLFVCSDGTEEKFYSMWYESIPERREQLIAGWAQFAIDLETHEPQAKTEKVVAEVISDLPAIKYQMNGMALKSNLDDFQLLALALIESSNGTLETDQNFADAESRQKIFSKGEAACDDACELALSESADISAFVNSLRDIKKQLSQSRLREAKLVKARKAELRERIIVLAENEVFVHTSIFKKLDVLPPVSDISISDAMKGKKMIDSLQNAADTAVSKIKIELNGWLEIAQENLSFIEHHKKYRFLFSDWRNIAFKANDDFKAIIKIRISEHKENERKKADDLREQIRKEEETKATAKAAAEQAKINAENAAKEKVKTEATQAKLDEEARLRNAKAKKASDEIEAYFLNAQATWDAEQLEARRQSEGAYERGISDERLTQRTGNTHTTSETVNTPNAVNPAPTPNTANSFTKSVFGRLPSLIEAAFAAGYLAGQEETKIIIEPKKHALAMARQYASNEAA
jgi:predicted phage-related endonuclease